MVVLRAVHSVGYSAGKLVGSMAALLVVGMAFSKDYWLVERMVARLVEQTVA